MSSEFFDMNVISNTLGRLSSELTSLLDDNDVLFEREMADFSKEHDTLSDKNLSNVEVTIDTLIGMCNFFTENPEKLSMELFNELRDDMYSVSSQIESVSTALASMSLVRLKLLSDIVEGFKASFDEIRFICSILISISKGNYPAIKLLLLGNNEPNLQVA